MSHRPLIAFDLGGTLEGMPGEALHADLQPALFAYFGHYPETQFGIATNGGLESAAHFIHEHGINELFGPEENPHIAYPGQLVYDQSTVEVVDALNWRQRLRHHQPTTHFETRVTQRKLRNKPAPDLLLHLIEMTGAAPETTIFVGDHQDDLMAATEAGVGFVAFDQIAHIIEPTSMADLLQQVHELLPEQ